MRWFIFLLLSLSGCTSGGSLSDAETAVASALAIIETGIDREDPILASRPVSDRFVIGTNIRTRYGNADMGTGQGEFRKFFNNAFLTLANVDQQFTLIDVSVNGQVASARVETRFDAVRIDTTPAENVTFSGTDYMVFELDRGAWRLVRWDEQPAD